MTGVQTCALPISGPRLRGPDYAEIVPLGACRPWGSDTALSAAILGIEVDPEVALAVLLRFHHHSSRLTQKQLAELLGMKNICSYLKLEKKSNPTLALIKKIHRFFPEINLVKII